MPASISDVFLADTQHTDQNPGQGRFTQYEVCTVLSDGTEHVAWRRFSEFERLHHDLKLPGVQFTPQKYFFGRFDEELIAKRRAELEVYLRDVVQAVRASSPGAPLVRFLSLPGALERSMGAVAEGTAPHRERNCASTVPPIAHVGTRGWVPGAGGAASSSLGPRRVSGDSSGRGGAAVPGAARTTGALPMVSGPPVNAVPVGASAGAYTPRADGQAALASNADGTPGITSSVPQAEAAARLDQADTVVVVSYMLPLHIELLSGGGDAPTGIGRRSTTDDSVGGPADSPTDAVRVVENGGFKWRLSWTESSLISQPQLAQGVGQAVGAVNWVGCPAWSCASAAEEESLSDALESIGCYALILTTQARAPHYRFCKRVLWPLFHNQSLHWGGRLAEPFEDEEWRSYCHVNKRMTDKVLEVAEPDSLIWVHDYHLLLLPSYLIRRLPVANVGLSLHTPFPSSDTFRALSVRDELLRAMLNADLVQFHLFEYARNFLACCKRMLGLEFEFKPGGFLGVECSGRHTMVSVSCAGINPPSLQPALERLRDGADTLERHWPEVAARLAELEAALPATTGGVGAGHGSARVALLVGIDEVDRLKGVPLKLHAYRQLLREHPELRGRVLLAQVGLLQHTSPVGGHSLSTQMALDVTMSGVGTEAVLGDGRWAGALAPPSPAGGAKATAGAGAEGAAGAAQMAGSAVAFLPDSVHEDVLQLVSQINAEFPGAVWYGEACELTPAQRAPLWARAAVALFTAVREGLNLLPVECAYVSGTLRGWRKASGKGGGQPPAALCVSEFSPASLTLNGAYRLNPWSKEKTAAAVDRALRSDSGERDARANKDLEYARLRTSEAWSSGVCRDIKQGRRSDSAQWTAVGFGLNVRMVGMGLHFQPLNTAAVTRAYRASDNRLIFLDWGGTLIPLDLPFYDARTDEAGAAPGGSGEAGGAVGSAEGLIPPATLQTLSDLADDKNNFLMVLSGLTRDKVDLAFGKAKGVACAAEHGYWYRAKSEGTDQWQTQYADRPMTWYEVAHAILQLYTARTAGTYIKKKGVSLTWKFDDADPEFGAMQAKELHHHLGQVLSAWNDVAVHTGKGYLEVQPRDINKGTMVDFMCTRITELRGTPPDFILCIGDDSADEFMFSALHQRYGASSEHPAVFTCTVGRKPSAARFYLPDHERVVELLSSMSMQSAGMAKFHSVAGNLAGLGGGGGVAMGSSMAGGLSSLGGDDGGDSVSGLASTLGRQTNLSKLSQPHVDLGGGSGGAGTGVPERGRLGRARQNTTAERSSTKL